jgi:hypothetical protein
MQGDQGVNAIVSCVVGSDPLVVYDIRTQFLMLRPSGIVSL